MPSGKQLSFAYGEVSPSLRFKSTAVSYAEGLYRLTNGYIRKAGGVSNRAGFKFLSVHEWQNDIPSEGGDPGVSIHKVKNNYVGAGLEDYTVLNISKLSGANMGFFTLDKGPNAKGTFQALPPFTFNNFPDPKLVHAFRVEDRILVTYGGSESAAGIHFFTIFWPKDSNPAFSDFSSPTPGPVNPATTVGVGAGSLAPANLPVKYIVMQELLDGTERFWMESVDPSTGHPHAQLSASILVNLVATDDVKRYNVYRSAGTKGSAFGYVGSIRLVDTVTTAETFHDYLPVADLLNGPPISTRLWGEQPIPVDYKAFQSLSAVRRGCVYQQRFFFAYDDIKDSNFKSGNIGVSKLGALNMLSAPEIYTATSAFDFRMPLEDNSPVVAMIPMERLVIMTKQQVFIVRGGEQGLISPTEINPLELSSEGCSSNIEPKKVGSKLYYVNKDHTKLMRISFTVDGNAVAEDVSVFSEHFFEDDISEIEVTRGESDIVWMVTRKGKLVSVTVLPETAGFARHETDGYVESIASISSPYDYWPNAKDSVVSPTDFAKEDTDILVATIIREGVRNIEAMVPRIDRFDEGFAYVDSYCNFGTRLTLLQDGKYNIATAPLNIQEGTDYSDGDPCVLFTDVNEVALAAVTYIDFYYDDADGFKRYLRFKRTGAPTWDGGLLEYRIPGYFESQVPAELIDVTLQNPANKLALQTRYTVPVNSVTGLTHLANKEVSVFGDEQVISCPLDPNFEPDILTVSAGGVLTLPDYIGYGIVGLPYTFEMETLALEASDNRTLTDANKLINAVGVALNETRQGYFGQSGAQGNIADMEELRVREEESFDIPETNFSGFTQIAVPGSWDTDGRAVIKQVKPLPISVLSVYPKGVSGD